LFYVDETLPPPGYKQALTSYAGNSGISVSGWGPAFPIEFRIEQAHATGTIYTHSAIKLCDITDGTSNTMLFSERDWTALKTLNKNNIPDAKFWWNSGYWPNNFCSVAPPNRSKQRPEYFERGTWWFICLVASSNHPGGVNVAFTDGSVRFVTDTVASWENSATPGVISAGGGFPAGLPEVTPFAGDYGTAKPDVWQFLSTRRGGEIISAGTY
jgi:prepilin-type processing-associated H-X9-DG protein